MTAGTMTKRKRGPRSLLWFAKRDAKKRGLKWQLGDTRALALLKMPCFWCGAPANPYSGIDRKDNEPFYRAANAVPCCWPCNKAKGTMTAMEWLRFCARIVAHRHAAVANGIGKLI
jgi:hypothetical protein